MRTHTDPAVGLTAQVLVLAALAGTIGLSGAGWLVGVTCGVVTNAVLARGMDRYRSERLGPADWVTLARVTLTGGVAALTADALGRPSPVTALVSLTGVALVLDAADGWVARRTHTESTLGGIFDGEADALLILVLSAYVARSAGVWVLAIGAARYVFFGAGRLLPWMRRTLPPRYWRKVVTGTVGVILLSAVSGVLPRVLTTGTLVLASALIAESFGRDVGWLWRRRSDEGGPVETPDGGQAAGHRRRRPEPAVRDHQVADHERGSAPAGARDG